MSNPRVNIVANTNYDDMFTVREGMLDSYWVKNTFILDSLENSIYSDWLDSNRYHSSADIKFGSTAPGMSMGVNAFPQATRTADIRHPGRLKARHNGGPAVRNVPAYDIHTPGHKYGLGFGRCYSEGIDDSRQRIFMRFGEPSYMGMFMWLGKSFDINKALLYKRGFISRVLIRLVSFASKILAIAVVPWLYLAKWVLNAFIQPGRFISLRDNMYTYWTMVDTLVNKMYVKSTGVPFLLDNFVTANNATMGQPQEVSKVFVQELNSMIPDVVDAKTGRISIHAVALRSQMAYARMTYDDRKRQQETFDITTDPSFYKISPDDHDAYFKINRGGNPSGFTQWLLDKAFNTIGGEGTVAQKSGTQEGQGAGMTLGAGIASMVTDTLDTIEDVSGGLIDTGGSGGEAVETKMRKVDVEEDVPYMASLNPGSTDGSGTELHPDLSNRDTDNSADGLMQSTLQNPDGAKQQEIDSYGQWMTTLLTEGAAFAIFDVEATGSVSESFTNSSGPNPIESAFNAASSTIRSAMSALGGVTEIPLIGKAITGLGDLAATATSSFTAGLTNPLLAILYNVGVVLPEYWTESTANMPTGNYKMKLITPYNNAFSRIFNIYIPLAMVMAGGLPRATGLDTHTAPFMCALYDRGRVHIPYGMISNISITRGTSSLAFSRQGEPNAIDLEFSVQDLNKIMTLDISGTGVLTRALEDLNPDFSDTAIENYVNALTGVDIFTLFHKSEDLRLKVLERSLNMRALVVDKAAQAAFTVDTVPGLGGIGRAIFGNSSSLVRDRTGM